MVRKAVKEAIRIAIAASRYWKKISYGVSIALRPGILLTRMRAMAIMTNERQRKDPTATFCRNAIWD